MNMLQAQACKLSARLGTGWHQIQPQDVHPLKVPNEHAAGTSMQAFSLAWAQDAGPSQQLWQLLEPHMLKHLPLPVLLALRGTCTMLRETADTACLASVVRQLGTCLPVGLHGAAKDREHLHRMLLAQQDVPALMRAGAPATLQHIPTQPTQRAHGLSWQPGSWPTGYLVLRMAAELDPATAYANNGAAFQALIDLPSTKELLLVDPHDCIKHPRPMGKDPSDRPEDCILSFAHWRGSPHI